ncbi:hypothetical protein WJX73_004923 [Symbiochloris irregularis]|uniref:Pseudouridine synthase I TruA alpha/beta domain-containing protein n=1 Tax=Symbiochloris irregularis TaxID=706552 RepID=A0AAW1NS32_9CHLO
MEDGKQAAEAGSADHKDAQPHNPAAKRKVALVLAYLGAGYAGMQFNPGQKTIESEVMDAMAKAGAVSAANAGQFGKVSWARAARTDKGVNALGQVVSLNMVLPDGVVDQINAHLPPAIRALGFCRVIKGFDARRLCDKRRYEYFLPAWAFDPSVCKPSADQPEIVFPGRPASPETANGRTNGESAASCLTPMQPADAPQMSADHYVGTHNYHNFTIRVHSSDPSATRYIKSFKCEDIVHLQGQPWVRMVVVGQSFMLHQIRKMVGLAVAIARGTAQDYVMHAALSGEHSVHVPLAPEGGLFLERCFFEAYNDRWKHTHGESVDVGLYADQVEDFKMSKLYPHIANSEAYRQQLQLFLRSLNERNFQFTRWKDVTSDKHTGSKPATFNDNAHTRADYSD